jgi:sterol desaturase/sphingolipid hydroxylase (fatty acid hydroxylase superfamily)
VRPTPWSTYSFHPLEATLLGSVMICLLLFWKVSIFAAILYPLVSLSMNVLGHSNFALFEGAASVRHSLHHQRVHGNYGFLAPWLDRGLGSTVTPARPRV